MTISDETALATINCSAKYALFQYQIKLLKFQPNPYNMLVKECLFNENVSNFIEKTNTFTDCFKDFAKIVKTSILQSMTLQLLLLLDRNSRCYEFCIKQTPLILFSILIHDTNLQEIELHETTVFRKQKIRTLKVVSTTFLLVSFGSLKEGTCETRKNVFYFTSKALSIDNQTLSFQIFKCYDIMKYETLNTF